MNIAELTRFKIMLLAHKEELQELEAAAQQSVAPDQSSDNNPIRAQGQQMAQATQRHRREELALVESALGRIATGNYANCLACGRDIDQQQLERNPSLTHCMTCAN